MYGYIYLTTNQKNGRMYVGQHKGKFDPEYLGSGLILRDAIKLYGKESFNVEVIHWAENKTQLNNLEVFEIKYRNAVVSSKYYNLAEGALGGALFKGRKHTEEAKRKNSEAHRGQTNRLGTKHSAETKRQMSNSQKNREKVECVHCGILTDPGNYGRWHGNNCKKRV